MEKLHLSDIQLQEIYNQYYFDETEITVKGFEGWEFNLDREDSEYDSEHGAQVNFYMLLLSPNGTQKYQGRSGYYTEITGMRFPKKTTFYKMSNFIKIEDNKVNIDLSFNIDFTLDSMLNDYKDSKIDKNILTNLIKDSFNKKLKEFNIKNIKINLYNKI